MSSFTLKIIACLCMFCDHFSDVFIKDVNFLNYIGRISFTIFAFQVVQGYIHTHDIKKYIFRLLNFALISQIPFMCFYYIAFDSFFAINVIFTLLLGLISILIYDKYNKFVGVSTCFLLGLISQISHFDYGFYGVFIIFIFYLLREKKIYMTITFILSAIMRYYIPLIKYGLPFSYLLSVNKYSLCMYFTCLSIIPILFYNNKKGKDAKYLFYIFYPLHLLILALLNLYLGK